MEEQLLSADLRPANLSMSRQLALAKGPGRIALPVDVGRGKYAQSATACLLENRDPDFSYHFSRHLSLRFRMMGVGRGNSGAHSKQPDPSGSNSMITFAR